MTNREFVSTILGRLHSLSKDDRISRRLILSTGLSISTTYHAQKLQDKTLFLEDNLFTKLECVEMIELPHKKCGGQAIRCGDLMRSKDKIDGLLYSRFGNSIVSVTNITDEIKFNKKTMESLLVKTPSRYAHLSKDVPSYFVFDKYLYIVNYPVKMVNIVYISLQRNDVIDKNGDLDECASILDYTFVCSDKILQNVIDGTIERLISIKQIPVDEKANLNTNDKN